MIRLPSLLTVLLALVVGAGSVAMGTPLCPMLGAAPAEVPERPGVPPCHPRPAAADEAKRPDAPGASETAPSAACCVLCAARALPVAASAPAALVTPAGYTFPDVLAPPTPLHRPATPPPRPSFA